MVTACFVHTTATLHKIYKKKKKEQGKILMASLANDTMYILIIYVR